MDHYRRNNHYSPIEQYAVIGDCHCAALISMSGSIDWLCLPRFDSPSVFGSILDAAKGGHFKIHPSDEFVAEQYYIQDTNVLQTVFETKNGRVRLTDLMPVATPADRASKLFPERQILRVIDCIDGEMEIKADFSPRPDYGRLAPRLRSRGALGLFCEYRGSLINLMSDLRLEICPGEQSAQGQVLLRKGERHYLCLTFTQGEPAIIPPLGRQADFMVENTINWWKDWAARCTYKGHFRDIIVRSALTLKLMTYAPSGAVIAAPTSSLPERLGSVRNWDYRYCWLRDASMTLNALYKIGYVEEAEAYLSWLIHSTRLTKPELRVVYDVYGETRLREKELDHLEGYAASRPVRVGNEAAEQLQLDIYGEAVNGVFAFLQWGKRVDHATADLLQGFGETVCKRWKEPDAGIWEIRSEPRHYTFSKVMCWIALDRLIRMHESGHIKAPVAKYARERDAIRSEIELHGFSEEIQSYTSSFDSRDVDISLLLLPIYGYVEHTHPRMLSTFARIHERLEENGLLYRYAPNYDGLPSGEGAFTLGGFWSVECLARQGNNQAAGQAFKHLLSYANHVGLFAEEIDPGTGAALGNFPQAYSHVGLINSAMALTERIDSQR